MLLKGTVAITRAGDDAAARRADEKNIKVCYLKIVCHLLYA